MLNFLSIVFATSQCFCHKIFNAVLIALDGILQVYKQMLPIFTWHHSNMSSPCLSCCLTEKKRDQPSQFWHCPPRFACEKETGSGNLRCEFAFHFIPFPEGYRTWLTEIFFGNCQHSQFKDILDILCICCCISMKLKLKEYVKTTYIHILTTCTCLRYLQVDWSEILLTDDMNHVIHLPSKVHISVWTDNALKCIDHWNSHQIHILSRVLDQFMDLKQENTDGATS